MMGLEDWLGLIKLRQQSAMESVLDLDAQRPLMSLNAAIHVSTIHLA
jgi:hypothetical protein